MSLPFSLFVGLRYTLAQRGKGFISLISLVSILGLMLGVAALIVVLSVMNGFDRELRQRILGMVPHATLSSYQSSMSDWQAVSAEVLQHSAVQAVAPIVEAQGMLAHAGQVSGVMINGVDPELEARISIIDNHFEVGSLDDLSAGEYHIILGEILARRLQLSIGDKVTLVLPEASVNITGVTPRFKRFTLTGIFKVGAELDSSMAYVHRDDAARLKRMPPGSVDGLRVGFDNLFLAPTLIRELAINLNRPLMISDWTRTHGNLFQAIQMEKRMISLLLFLIVFVAAFNIVSTLVMVVTDKRADIAILRTMGATPSLIMRVFMVQGIVIGLIGTLLGTLLGIILALSVSDIVLFIERAFGIEFLSAEVYFINYLPSELLADDVVTIVTSAFCISFLATLYPAWKASKTQPAEALRYE